MRPNHEVERMLNQRTGSTPLTPNVEAVEKVIFHKIAIFKIK